MIHRTSWTRAALITAAAFVLASCQTEGLTPTTKAMRPLSDKMIGELASKNMEKTSPILVRLFKQEAELEVWKQDRTGHFALVKTYPICRWSGELGPKVKEGDRQAPEGFYSITPGQMNPNSSYYLSFDLGYPNAFDRSLGRTGSNLMVHGDCSSRGCYAMTDEQVAEIYALGRESFFGGQRAFQVQAYPFRMTPTNMAKHRANPHMAFWRMLKQGYDHFEVTKLEPKVNVCEKRYVFNASAPEASVMANGATPALNFNAASKCPVFEVPAEIAEAVNEKQRKDEVEIAELTRRNVPVAPIRMNTDGGMNPVFLAALNTKGQEVRDADGNIRAITAPISATPGTIPAHVNPPRIAQPQYADGTMPAAEAAPVVTASNVSAPRTGPQAKEGPTFTDKIGSLFGSRSEPQPAPTRVASADASAQPAKSGGFFSRMFNKSDAASQPKPAEAAPKESVTSRVGRAVGLRGSEPAAKPAPAPVQQAARPQSRPQTADAQPEPAQTASTPASRPAPAPGQVAQTGGLMTGAQPVMPTASFDARWGALR